MFHGLWVILGNATLRQFAIGIAIAIVLVAVFAGYQVFTANEGEHPSDWLTQTEQAELAQAIQSLEADGGWVAGCLWDGDDKDITDRVDVPSGQRERYVATASSSRAMAFVVVPGAPPAASYEPLERRGSYCLVPRQS